MTEPAELSDDDIRNIKLAIAGDAHAVDRLTNLDGAVVRAWQSASRTTLVVGLQAVRRVVSDLLEHTITPDAAYRGAALVFWGSLGPGEWLRPDQPDFYRRLPPSQLAISARHPEDIIETVVRYGPSDLDVDYDETHSDVIADIVKRLDDIGDLIDGEVGDIELRDCLVRIDHAQ